MSGENGSVSRGDFEVFYPLTTRWSDNDLYGHVNNVTYYSYFDSVANRYLIEEGGLDIHAGEVIGLVVKSNCEYWHPLAYPDAIEAGFRVERLGNSSVTYGIAVFKTGEDSAAAYGHFVHVFVDREQRRPIPISGQLREALEKVLV